jgi:hypothetical protein
VEHHDGAIIAAFIKKERRARWSLSLGDSTRRPAFLDRLNHCDELDERCCTWLESNVDIAELLTKAGAPRDCYVVSSAAELDGRVMALRDALDAVPRHGWGTIVSCIPGRLAYYYDEEGVRRCILKLKRS